MDDSNQSNQIRLTTLSEVLQDHELAGIADVLGTFLKVGCDQISLSVFLVLSSSLVGLPVFLQIISQWPGMDVIIVDRILSLAADVVKQPKTVKELHDLKNSHFNTCKLIWPRHDWRRLLRHTIELALADINSHDSLPAVLSVSDTVPISGQLGPLITLLTPKMHRCVKGSGHLYSTPDTSVHLVAEKRLRELLKLVELVASPICPFEEHIKSFFLSPEDMLFFNRILRTVTALRGAWIAVLTDSQSNLKVTCTLSDYRVARDFLSILPIAGDDGTLSSGAIEIATRLFLALRSQELKGTSLADQSEFGCEAFDRTSAQRLTGLSYNTVKKYFTELEDEGIFESTRAPTIRGPGLQIFYRFARNRSPPFIRRNRFLQLPSDAQIAAFCKPSAQT